MAAQDALDVGVAARGGADAQDDLARAGDGLVDVVDPQIAGAVESGGPHAP